MTISVQRRRQALWLASLLTAALCGWTAWRDRADASLPSSEIAPIREVAVTVSTTSNVDVVRRDAKNLVERDPLVVSEAELFRYTSFQPPLIAPPQPPPPPPPAKPSAPAFPYQYFGRMVDVDGRTVTYLARGDSLVPIRARQVLDGVYRIDAVTETQIVVTYVPLEEKIAIAVQAGN